FATALDTMRLDIGRYPTQSEGIDLLRDPNAAETEIRNWYGPYIEEIPADPWGAAYFYQPPERDQSGFETRPFIFTYGADQQQGGDGLDRDLGRLPDSDTG
ncbi:MAG: type II secretion system protein GspG, partial [Pseudomonadota bacterium]